MASSFTILENTGGPTVDVRFNVNGVNYRYETPKKPIWTDSIRDAQALLIVESENQLIQVQTALDEVRLIDPSK